MRKELVVDAHIQFDHTRNRSATDDDIIERSLLEFGLLSRADGFNQRSLLDGKFVIPDFLQSISKLMRGDGCQETQSAHVDTKDRSIHPINLPDNAKDSAIATADHKQIDFLGECDS